jgi:hypothetical protein
MARGVADAFAFRPEGERQRSGAQQTYVVLPVADRDHALRGELGMSGQMAQDIQFARSVLMAALRMTRHRLSDRRFSGRFIVAESQRVRDAEIREDPASRYLRNDEETVGDDADAVAEPAETDDRFDRARRFFIKFRLAEKTFPEESPKKIGQDRSKKATLCAKSHAHYATRIGRCTAIAGDLHEWFEHLIELRLAFELINAAIFNLYACMRAWKTA